jgi:hypothetical protein
MMKILALVDDSSVKMEGSMELSPVCTELILIAVISMAL